MLQLRNEVESLAQQLNQYYIECLPDCLRVFGLIPKIDAEFEVHDRMARPITAKEDHRPDLPLFVKVIPRHSRIRGRCR